ncbi:hypothetical protein BAAM0483_05430 [Bifidobacterium animalis subsp. animalis MCC 0483]|uniref:Uncharacterized protein n=1 Tax=Bifidobacterium animalis subsp. animalis MCC 0483 TaxID=1365955 RepID=A0AB34T926_9BIFI|nr:hypothetical protein BAAM0483_05430 [Bifidobacterium animalis subsp. animalis MCC 0483]
MDPVPPTPSEPDARPEEPVASAQDPNPAPMLDEPEDWTREFLTPQPDDKPEHHDRPTGMPQPPEVMPDDPTGTGIDASQWDTGPDADNTLFSDGNPFNDEPEADTQPAQPVATQQSIPEPAPVTQSESEPTVDGSDWTSMLDGTDTTPTLHLAWEDPEDTAETETVPQEETAVETAPAIAWDTPTPSKTERQPAVPAVESTDDWSNIINTPDTDEDERSEGRRLRPLLAGLCAGTLLLAAAIWGTWAAVDHIRVSQADKACAAWSMQVDRYKRLFDLAQPYKLEAGPAPAGACPTENTADKTVDLEHRLDELESMIGKETGIRWKNTQSALKDALAKYPDMSAGTKTTISTLLAEPVGDTAAYRVFERKAGQTVEAAKAEQANHDRLAGQRKAEEKRKADAEAKRKADEQRRKEEEQRKADEQASRQEQAQATVPQYTAPQYTAPQQPAAPQYTAPQPVAPTPAPVTPTPRPAPVAPATPQGDNSAEM